MFSAISGKLSTAVPVVELSKPALSIDTNSSITLPSPSKLGATEISTVGTPLESVETITPSVGQLELV